MGIHLEWLNANTTSVAVAHPGSPEHPALNTDDPATAQTMFALTLCDDSGAVIEGSADDLARILAQATEHLAVARAEVALLDPCPDCGAAPGTECSWACMSHANPRGE